MKRKHLPWLAICLSASMTFQMASPVMAANLETGVIQEVVESEEEPEELKEAVTQETTTSVQEERATEQEPKNSVEEKEDHTDTIEEKVGDDKVEAEKNLAKNKKVVARETKGDQEAKVNPDKPLSMITDGIIGDNSDRNYGEFSTTGDSVYVQIDLEKSTDITRIKLYRYWNDHRKYKGTVIAVAENESDFSAEDKSKVQIVYNSDQTNVHGFGEGKDELYQETKEGKEFIANEGTHGRYVRIYASGKEGETQVEKGNHVNECQVFVPTSTEDPEKEDPEVQNLSQGKKAVGRKFEDDSPLDAENGKPYSNAVDGIINDTNNYAAFGEGYVASYLEIDLKAHCEVTGIELYRYWQDSRIYKGTVIVAADSKEDFSNPDKRFVLYNSDQENKFQFGSGQDALYNESAEGLKIDVGDTKVNPVRFVRVYMNGSKQNGSNHIVECKVLGYASESKYEEKAFEHAQTPIENVSNPDIAEAPKDFKNSGYYVSYIKDKKPYVVHSNDGKTLETSKAVELSDKNAISTDIVYDSKEKRFIAYWVDEATSEVQVKISDDGTSWREPKKAKGKFKEEVTGISVLHNEYLELFFLYYNSDGKTWVRWSKDGVNWSEEKRDTDFGIPSKAQDVQFIEEIKEYWALIQGDSNGKDVLYMAKSKDGMHWKKVGTQSLLEAGNLDWNNQGITRSTFLYNTKNHKLILWYAAKGDQKFGVGVTENTLDKVNKSLYADEFYETDYNIVKSKGFILTADKPVLEAKGDTTDTTRKWSTGGGTYDPENLETDMNVKYTSSDEKIATVDPWGKVTAVSDGAVLITGTTQEGSETDILITVGEQKKEKARHVISREKPLYLANYYWADGADSDKISEGNAKDNYISDELNPDGTRKIGDDPLKLWNSVPDDLKENTVILLIGERSIRDDIILKDTQDVNAVRQWYKDQVEFCNKHQIPCAVQNLNGETSTFDRIPLSFWKELAEQNEYLVGFNGAELYNRFSGGAINNADEHVADLIRIGASLGVSMMWTDTNTFGEHGVLLDWLEKENSHLSSAMLDNHEYISMMYKESYGSPVTDALLLGLWLTGYCDSWGVASDWWHWQLDGNQTLFDGPGTLGGWGQCQILPENMYSQDIIRVASMGATAYKNEPQFYSVATVGERTPAYQYSIMPTLQKVCSGAIDIPTKEEVLERTKLIVKGQEDYANVIYDMSVSNLYPKTGQYGIVPVVPNNVPEDRLEGFDVVVDGYKLTEEKLKETYPKEKYAGTAWAENYGDTWYLMNSSEDKNVDQYADIVVGGVGMNVTMTPHTYSVITDRKGKGLDVILSNYRLDKSELTNGEYSLREDKKDVYHYIWKQIERMKKDEGHDKELRDTTFVIKSQEKPILKFKNDGKNSYAPDNYTRPYVYTDVTGSAGNWTVTVKHNGFVEFTIYSNEEEWEEIGPSTPVKNIQTVANLDQIVVPYGTEFKDLKLPKTVEVTLTNDAKAEVNVTWSAKTYKHDLAGIYELVGELELNDGIENTNNLQAKISVEVQPKETKPSKPDSSEQTGKPDSSEQTGKPNTTDQTGKPNVTEQTDKKTPTSTPKTGDSLKNVYVWTTVVLGAGISVFTLAYYKKRKQNKKEK